MADERSALVLPTAAPDPSDVCPPCGKCCRYVAVGIDPPDSVKRVSTLLWMLYHRGLTAYESHEGDWFLLVPAACGNLRPDGLCGIYEARPLICREYDVHGCEGTSADAPEKTSVPDARALIDWLRRRRPSLLERCRRAGIVPAD